METDLGCSHTPVVSILTTSAYCSHPINPNQSTYLRHRHPHLPSHLALNFSFMMIAFSDYSIHRF
jgi:hypothetical protein